MVGEEEAIFPSRVPAGRKRGRFWQQWRNTLGTRGKPDPFCRLLSNPGRSPVTNVSLKLALFLTKLLLQFSVSQIKYKTIRFTCSTWNEIKNNLTITNAWKPDLKRNVWLPPSPIQVHKNALFYSQRDRIWLFFKKYCFFKNAMKLRAGSNLRHYLLGNVS